MGCAAPPRARPHATRLEGSPLIRLVLSDLDSTLIWREDHVITSRALAAVHALMDAGVRFAPCTGRIDRDLPAMFGGDELACSTAVTSNGQLVYLDGELVEKVAIAREALLGVARELSDVADAYLVVEYGGEKVAVAAELDYVLAHPDNFWSVRRALPTVPAEPCYKANVRVVGSFARCQEVAAALGAALPELDFVCPMPGTPHIDVTPHGFGKDHGGDFLPAERLGLLRRGGLLLRRRRERPRGPAALPQLRGGGKRRARRARVRPLARGARQRGLGRRRPSRHSRRHVRGPDALVHVRQLESRA